MNTFMNWLADSFVPKSNNIKQALDFRIGLHYAEGNSIHFNRLRNISIQCACVLFSITAGSGADQ